MKHIALYCRVSLSNCSQTTDNQRIRLVEYAERIGFISISDNLDFSTASGKLHFQIQSAFAEFERELIRERTMEGLRRSKLQGKQAGRPKGSKDSVRRKRSGYILREARKRQKAESDAGVHKSIEAYLN